MKLPVRIILALLCAAMVLAAPFVLSAPNMLGEVKWMLLDEMEGEDEGLLFRLLPRACAEEAADYALPVDFTPVREWTDYGMSDKRLMSRSFSAGRVSLTFIPVPAEYSSFFPEQVQLPWKSL